MSMDPTQMMNMFQQMMKTFQEQQSQREILLLQEQERMRQNYENLINQQTETIKTLLSERQNLTNQPSQSIPQVQPQITTQTQFDNHSLVPGVSIPFNLPLNATNSLSVSQNQLISSNGRTGFTLWSEELFRQQSPQFYEQIRAQPGFNPEFFTISTEMVPIYAKNMTMRQFSNLHGMFNNAIWSTVPQGSKDRYRKQSERMLALNDPGYRPRDTNNLVNTNQALQPQAAIIRDGTMRQAARVLQRIGATNIPITEQRFLPTSILQPEILRRYDGSIPGITQVPERAYFNGLVTRTTYYINSQISASLEQFETLVKKAIYQRLSTDYIANSTHPPYYNVYVYFLGEPDISGANAPMDKVLIYSGLGAERINDVQILPNLQSQILELYGSDPNKTQEYRIDTTHFDIEKIDVTRSGGGSHTYLKVNYSWGKVREYLSKNDGCFPKILSEVLKSLNFKYRYTNLWRLLDTHFQTNTYGTCVSVEWATNAALLFGLSLIVINYNGEIIYGDVNAPPNQILRVLLNNHHYSHVTLWRPISVESHPKDRHIGPDREEPLRITSKVYYDLETVYTVEPGADSHTVPYANSWCIDNNEVMVSIEADPNPYKVLDHMLYAIVTNFQTRDDLPIPSSPQNKNKQKSNVHVLYKLIAYNGSRFDHLILFLYMAVSGWYIVQAPQPTGKLRSMVFYLGERLHDGYLSKCYLTVWDPCLFTCSPLAKVAKEFNLQLLKGELNHSEVQTMYEQGNLALWLQNNQQQIIEYNKRDVEVLRLLVLKVEEVLGLEIYNSQTIAGMCYKVWNGLKYLNNKPLSEICHAVLNPHIDSRIRKAIIGGRVEAEIGDHQGDFVMYDIVSLYPYVMQHGDYPIGTETIIYDPTEALRCYQRPDVIGFYHVSYDQQCMQGKYYHPILPNRQEGETLNWKTFGTGIAWLPDITIRDLLDVNVPINFVPDSEGCVAILWQKAKPGTIFGAYINKYGELKKQEDRKKALGLPFNGALREMSKIMLNSLSGKMSQKNYKNKNKLWSNEAKLRQYITNKIENGDKPIIHLVCKDIAFTMETKTIDEAYRRPHPSQIGVFIYAYARSYMWKLFFSKMKVWYSDTDSAIITKQDSLLLNPKTIVNTVIPSGTIPIKEFGMIEQEQECNRVIIAAPKTYILLKGQKVLKSRMKGVRDTDSWQGKPIKDNILEFYQQLLKERRVEVQTWTFRNQIKEGRLERKEMNKTLTLN